MNPHPLFGPNRLKLGVFGLNGSGTVMTTHPDRHIPSWASTAPVVRAADEAGLEAIVPYSRWHGFGDARHVSGMALDPFVWAGALGACTSRAALFSTVHTPTLHPIVAAKQGATIDDVSGGRFALNVVCGWFEPDMDMFGAGTLDHDRRYDHADEWVRLVKRLWTEEDGFDFDGEFFSVRDAMLAPKPLRRPMPPIMNAGSSGRGRAFAAEHADVAFIVIPDPTPEVVREQVASYKRYAREEFGRDIQVWAYSLVLQRQSLDVARADLERYTVEYGDHDAIDTFVAYQVKNHAETAPEILQGIREAVAGGGGVHLLGDAEDIAGRLAMLSEAGVDGVLTTFVDYGAGLRGFVDTVVPLLEQAGLRAPAGAAAAQAAA
jgi:alkanesulfonate monooxygenase SsuD/methylene tetrahydromethanopterin reductase-like flavin-dependent oxidoreductase (luciferase family)